MYSKLENQATAMGVLRTRDWLLCLADFFWSSVVIAPLVILYWRGSWDLLDDLVRGIMSCSQCVSLILFCSRSIRQNRKKV